MLPKVTFILGGAASGKSEFAETLAERYRKTKIYVATAKPLDDETREKVQRHRQRRGNGWTTIEAPYDLAPALSEFGPDHVGLIDCATMWLSNHLVAGNDLETEQNRLLGAISCCAADLIIVSNEVGHGIVPDNALARRFREAQGRLNIALAAHADCAVLVTAGLPLLLKGRLP